MKTRVVAVRCLDGKYRPFCTRPEYAGPRAYVGSAFEDFKCGASLDGRSMVYEAPLPALSTNGFAYACDQTMHAQPEKFVDQWEKLADNKRLFVCSATKTFRTRNERVGFKNLEPIYIFNPYDEPF